MLSIQVTKWNVSCGRALHILLCYVACTVNHALGGLVGDGPDASRLQQYADADFAGMFNPDEGEDPVSVKSRTGWIMALKNVPITWSRKIQGEIALSTMEAEYITLSTGIRELIEMRKLLNVK